MSRWSLTRVIRDRNGREVLTMTRIGYAVTVVGSTTTAAVGIYLWGKILTWW